MFLRKKNSILVALNIFNAMSFCGVRMVLIIVK